MGGILEPNPRDDYVTSYLPRLGRLCQASRQVIPSSFMSVPTFSVPSPPRSARPLAARKQLIDPLWPSTNPTSVISAKRQAVERVEGEPRNKRKRVEPTLQTTSQFGHRGDKPQERQHDESPVVSWVSLVLPSGRLSRPKSRSVNNASCWGRMFIISRQMDFSTLPVEALHRYLAQYDLIPAVHPSPLSVHDPPPPPSLLGPIRGSSRGASPPAVTTPANRPRRQSREQSRRRSSRLLEEGRARTPVLADVAEVQSVLASIAQRHFESQVVKEVDSLASFMCAVKGRGRSSWFL
jgi:hypothetical protein